MSNEKGTTTPESCTCSSIWNADCWSSNYGSSPWNKLSRSNRSMVGSSGSSYHASSLPCNLRPRLWCLKAVLHLDQTSFLQPTPMDSGHAWSRWPSSRSHLQPCRTCCLHPGIWLSEHHWSDAVVEANPSWSHATTLAESCSLLANVAQSKPKRIDINKRNITGHCNLQSNCILWSLAWPEYISNQHQPASIVSPRSRSRCHHGRIGAPGPRKLFFTVILCQGSNLMIPPTPPNPEA